MATFTRCDVCGKEGGTKRLKISDEQAAGGWSGHRIDVCQGCRKALYEALGKAGKAVATSLHDERTLVETV